MQKVKYLILLLLCFTLKESLSQDISNFTQFFVNPYTLNPSFAGIDGRNALFLSYRKQWSGIEGGPTVANFSYHTPLKNGLNFGLNVANDSRGILNNSGLLLTAAYSVSIGEGKFIRFGLSGGGSWNTVDLAQLEDFGSDPAIANLLDKSASVIGNAGISAHLKTFHIGATMPAIFAPSYVSTDAFTLTEVKPFEALIFHASNRFYFSNNKHMFEPYVVYRLNTNLPSQYEFAGVLHLNHLIWLGGSYKQEFGISALGGIKLNKMFAIGGSYTLPNNGINELNFPTYEIHLSLLGGASKSKAKTKNKSTPHIQSYSFIDTEIKKLTPRELAAEKKKQEELEKKKQEEAQAKLAAEEQKKQEEALAKQQAEEKKKQEAQAQQAAEEKKKQEVQAQKAAEEKRLADEQAARKAAEEKKLAEAAAAAVIVSKVPEKEPVKETPKEPVKEVPKETIKETPKEPVKETPKEPIKETPKETVKETPKEPVKEAPKETVKVVPVEPQKEDTGPERTSKFSGGSNPLELPVGNYVIVGAFSSRTNAINMARGLVYVGFNANYGFSPEKNLWYVHVFEDNDINRVRTERNKYRRMPKFKDAWLLTIEK